MVSPTRAYRAGESLEDFCRACKTDRMHTVIVVDGDGLPIRVSCGFCHSEHNYRGGPRIGVGAGGPAFARGAPAVAGSATAGKPPISARPSRVRGPIRDRDLNPATTPSRSSPTEKGPAPSMPLDPDTDLELLLRRVIREGNRHHRGDARGQDGAAARSSFDPARPGLQDRSWPIEDLLPQGRDAPQRLRTLEQQVNAADLPDDVKVRPCRDCISGCYGTLTASTLLDGRSCCSRQEG